MPFVANNRLNLPLPPTPPNKRGLRPSSCSRTSRCCRMPQPKTWDRSLQSWQAVALPSRSTGPLALNTTCMFRVGDGRMTFTVTLQLEVFTFPHLLCAFSLQIHFLLCPPAPMHRLHAAAAHQPSPERRGSWCCKLNGKAARKRVEQALTAARQPR